MGARGASRAVTALVLLLAAARVPAIDTGGLRLYGLTEHFTVYAGDGADYAGMLAALEEQYRRLVAKYDLAFDGRIGVYVYPDQFTFVRKVFGWTTVEMNVAGLADHVSRRLFLTSIFDPCKPPEHMRKMPLHELTHVLLPSGMIWVREGVATYEAGMLTSVEAGSIPRALADMPFYRSDDDSVKAYNLAGWLVKFIVEGLLAGTAPRFVRFARSPTDWAAIGVAGERELMDRWHRWMEARPAAAGED
jgi:hypothetical protein